MSYTNFQIIENHLSSPFFNPFPSFQHLTFSLLNSEFNSAVTELSDRVSSLESKFDRLLHVEQRNKLKSLNEVDRRYSWTAEIKGGDDDVERKYKWTAEIERDDYEKGKRGERKYQWSSEIKGGKFHSSERKYTWKATIGGQDNNKKENKIWKRSSVTRSIVDVDQFCDDHRNVILRQAFSKRTSNNKGKRQLSPLDAANLIQFSFRNYLIRRSQALRALRELAVAKTKLKELRTLFYNFSYRSHISRDAEERQKFSEKIIVLLLTVDAIKGVDLMVRAAKRSMIDELEAMLDMADPQPGTRSISMRRRTFDMPSDNIQQEIAEGVAQVVQMLDEENGTV